MPQKRYAFHRWQATVFNAGELTDPIKNAISASFQRKGGSLTATLRINAAQRPDSYCSKYSDPTMRLNSPSLLDSSCVGGLMVGQVVGGVEHRRGKRVPWTARTPVQIRRSATVNAGMAREPCVDFKHTFAESDVDVFFDSRTVF